MLVQLQRRSAKLECTLVQCLMFDGIVHYAILLNNMKIVILIVVIGHKVRIYRSLHTTQ